MRFNNNQFTSLNESIFRLNESVVPPEGQEWEIQEPIKGDTYNPYHVRKPFPDLPAPHAPPCFDDGCAVWDGRHWVLNGRTLVRRNDGTWGWLDQYNLFWDRTIA